MCGFAAVALAAQWCLAAPPVKTKTLQNLSGGEGRHFGKYLSIDGTNGQLVLSSVTGQEASGTYWEVERTYNPHRDYTAHVIRSRGNSRFNGFYLGIDEATGQLIMTQLDSPDKEPTKWLIRYAGKYDGYDSYYIQNLAHSSGGFDMSFLAVDEATGEVKLSREPQATVNWFLRPSPTLPTERIR